MYILVIVDTSTNYAYISDVTEYQHGRSKCLNFHCVSEARFIERYIFYMTENMVRYENILIKKETNKK